MAAIYRKYIDHPSAWTNRSIGGKAGLMCRLTAQHLDALDEVLARTRHVNPQEITRADFDHPRLNPLLAELFDLIQNGRGAVVITGVTRERYSEEDFERIYWGFGTHWGTAVIQSAFGDRLGRVRFTPVSPDNPTNRAYRSNEELTPHTDSNEIVGLMAVQKAKSGGYSQLTSSLAIHNEILRNRPDLLDPLYEGFNYASREASTTAQPVTPYKIPVFCYLDGKVSCHYVGEFIRVAAQKMGVVLPPGLSEALDYFDQVATRDDIRAHFMLEPGEMMIVNNFTVLHARTNFEDSSEQKRHLLRLWIDVQEGREVIPEYHRTAEEYRKVGIETQAAITSGATV
jgi:hypothetical protein